MKISNKIIGLICLSCSTFTTANPKNIAVFATEKDIGSIFMGGKSAYTKSYDIGLAKLSGDNIDLSKMCLIASIGNKEFKVDTVDEVLATGILKSNQPIKGLAVFAAETDEILKPTLIKISEKCK